MIEMSRSSVNPMIEASRLDLVRNLPVMAATPPIFTGAGYLLYKAGIYAAEGV